MIKNQPVALLIFALLLNSCAFLLPSPKVTELPAKREIANENLPGIDELFLFKATGSVQTTNQIQDIKYQLDYSFRGIEIEFIPDDKMPNDEAFRLEPVIKDNKYRLLIHHSASGIYDNGAAQEVTKFLGKFSDNSDIPSTYALMELYYNAKQNDITALSVISRMRKETVHQIPERTKEWEEIEEQFLKAERVHNKSVKAESAKRKAVMDALDKATDDQQFRTMVAKGDRKGVAKLLRSYLPWEMMPPFEKLFWENQLAVMADPLPLEQRVMMYRGIDDDLIQMPIEGGKALTKEEALKEQKMFLMSTMMTKNQGTWNRRLRSLTAMYDKYMGTNYSNVNDYTRAARITTMFTKHSSEPKGSPFLSLTPKYSVAQGFGYRRNSVYFIDPRLFHFNYASRYGSEIEFLLPLITFPDELGAVWDLEVHGNVGSVEEFLKKTATEKLERELGKGKGINAFANIGLNTVKFTKPVHSKGGALPATSDFFKQNLGIETGKLAKKMEATTDIQCMDLIQLFWK